MELLAVIFIISILIAIGVTAGIKIKTSANKQNTIATMKIVINAIDAYREETGNYPDNAGLPAGRYRYSDGLHRDLFGIGTSYSPAINPTSWTFAPESVGKEKLTELTEAVLKVVHVPRPGDTSRTVPAFSDGFKKVMLYLPQAGMGGRPVLISAGADGKFGPDIEYYFGGSWDEDSTEAADGEDNIRSDK